MATERNRSAEQTGAQLKQRFSQSKRAGLPFNPVADPVDFKGANVERLKEAMTTHGWTDLRFVTESQAKASGWQIKSRAPRVEIPVRNDEDGTFSKVVLVNAQSVLGMPSEQEIQDMSDAMVESLGREQDLAAVTPVSLAEKAVTPEAGSHLEEQHDAVVITPAELHLEQQQPRLLPVSMEFVAPTFPALGDEILQEEDPSRVLQAGAPEQQSLPVSELQPGYNWLISHGRKPYLDDEKNNLSFFVELEDESGARSMLWGLGLEKSLEEAGARIGDAVSITEVGRKDVTVQVKNGDKIVQQPGQRIEWKTQVQPKLTVDTRAPEMVHTQDAATPDKHTNTNFGDPVAQAPAKDRFAVMAPYWLNGLHNFTGLAIADEINELIKEQQLSRSKDAIEGLLRTHAKARSMGLAVVEETKYLDDPWRKTNPCEPRQLLNGDLIRDSVGEYRPKTGGLSVLKDGGDSLTLKERSDVAYRGAMELARAKGWKAISLKGKPAVLADAWVEAKLMGLEVVNYSPTEQDRARYAQRLAELERAERGGESLLEIRPQVEEKAVVNSGQHVGPIIAVEGDRIAQKTGRDPAHVVWHDAANLDGGAPSVGASVEIAYKDGRGTVVTKQLEQGRGGVGR